MKKWFGCMFMCLEEGIASICVFACRFACVCVCESLVYPGISLQSLVLTLLAASPLHY